MAGYIVLTKIGFVLRRKENKYMKKEVPDRRDPFSGINAIYSG